MSEASNVVDLDQSPEAKRKMVEALAEAGILKMDVMRGDGKRSGAKKKFEVYGEVEDKGDGNTSSKVGFRFTIEW